MKRTAMRRVSAKKAKRATPLRKAAQDEPCTLRLSGCRHDSAHTVLCHIRRFGWAGMGQKPNDLLAFFACDVCHDKQERRNAEVTDEDLLRAMGETLMIHLQRGTIRIEGDDRVD